jgi:phosphohistidine phosphatase
VSVELILVRHAIAFERDRQRWPDDRLRPLSPAGRKRFRKAAQGLGRWLPEIDRVFTSPLVRARETATLLTEHAGWPTAVDCPPLAPGSDPEAVFKFLRKQRGTRMALVGHEPHLSTLIAACLRGSASARAFEMKKGGVACICFEGRAGAGAGMLTVFAPPRVLRAMR